MALKFLNEYGEFDDEEEDEEDDEDEENEDEEDGEEEEENPDGYGEEYDPYAMFNDEEEEYDDDDDELDDGSGSNKDKKSKKDKKKSKKESQELEANGKKKVKSNANTSKASMKKDAVAHGCSPMAEGQCPYCHQLSIHKSYKIGDVSYCLAFKLFGKKVSRFYCFNKKCNYSYYRHYCFNCGGDRWIGSKIVTKQIMRID